MEFIDFKKRERFETKKYQTVKIDLRLHDMMDMKLSKFTDSLEISIHNILNRKQVKQIDKPIYFKIETDLDKEDLAITKNTIISILADYLIKNKTKYKHNERILAVPENLYDINMVVATAMDLINYNLHNEQFTITFFDKNTDKL